MCGVTEMLLAVFLLTDLMLAAASRLLHCIRVVVAQGILLGILPLVMWDFQVSPPHGKMIFVAVVNVMVKGVVLPYLLNQAMRQANVRRELEPYVGYGMSLGIVLLLLAGSFYFAGQLEMPKNSVAQFSTPIAFTTMLTGLFLVVSRRKALTQVIGFLIFENGISIFGTGLMLEYGLLVELGILLDVLVLVFVVGIVLFQINREFDHIDSDRLNALADTGVVMEQNKRGEEE